MSRAVNENDTYMSRLLKNIPSEILGVYVAIAGIPMAQQSSWMLWVVFGVCLIATPLCLYFMQEVRSWLQIILTTVAFVIWVMTLGGPFASFWPEVTLLGSVLMILFTGLVAPLLAAIAAKA